MAVPGSDPGVATRDQICVTGVTGEPIEIRRQREPVAFGDPASAANVLAGTLLIVRASSRFGLLVQDIDSLAGELSIGPHLFDGRRTRPLGVSFRSESASPVHRRYAASRVGNVIDTAELLSGVRVLNYLEFEDRLDRSGISTSVAHQRAALSRTDADVRYLTTPWYGGDMVLAGLNRLVNGQGLAEFDLVHANMIGPGTAFVVRQAKRKDIPVVLHAHVTSEDFAESFRGSNLLAKPLRRYLKWFYSQADLVLCPSEYTRRTLEDYPIGAPIRSITNGIDLDSMAGHEQFREEYRDQYELEGMVVFAVGSVFERKGLTTFCEVAQTTEYDFAWFGEYDGSLLGSRTVRKWTKHPPENVTFTGWIEDKRGAFAAGDVFLFPSKVENQGLVVLEAMAAGKAVVLRDIPVFREYYEDGQDCLLCSTREEFEDALERLKANPQLRERLGENAKETAQQHSLDRVAEGLVDAYQEVTTH